MASLLCAVLTLRLSKKICVLFVIMTSTVRGLANLQNCAGRRVRKHVGHCVTHAAFAFKLCFLYFTEPFGTRAPQPPWGHLFEITRYEFRIHEFMNLRILRDDELFFIHSLCKHTCFDLYDRVLRVYETASYNAKKIVYLGTRLIRSQIEDKRNQTGKHHSIQLGFIPSLIDGVWFFLATFPAINSDKIL